MDELNEYKEQLEGFLDEGNTVREIAALYGVSTPTIYADLKKLGINSPQGSTASDTIDKDIARLVRTHTPISEITKLVGRSRENVYLRLRNMGLDPPMAKKGRVCTDNRVRRIAEFLKSSRTWSELCTEFDVTEATLYKDLSRIEEKGLGIVVVSLSEPQ